jgi:DNA transformation protein and related proteins
MSAPRDPLKELLLDALMPLGPIAARRFFSGVGFTYDGTLFAMLMRDTLFMRVDARNRPRFEAAGSRPFSYSTRKGRVKVATYFSLPEALLDDEEELREWARQSIAAALDHKKPPARKRSAPSRKSKKPKSAVSGRSGRGPPAPSRASYRRTNRSP